MGWWSAATVGYGASVGVDSRCKILSLASHAQLCICGTEDTTKDIAPPSPNALRVIGNSNVLLCGEEREV